MSQSRAARAAQRPLEFRSLSALAVVRAGFRRRDRTIVAPFDLRLAAGESAALAGPDPYAASVLARMCAAIVKPTSGTIYVGDFDARLQPVHAKRLVGFVDRAGFRGDRHDFATCVEFRRLAWGLPREHAAERIAGLREAFGEDRYALALALALLPQVALLVLDQPPPALVARARRAAPQVACLETRVASAPLELPAHAVEIGLR
ncbi:MAG: hypothetical protein ACREM2_05265 [Vulcanimicrobiaceae bacterium]